MVVAFYFNFKIVNMIMDNNAMEFNKIQNI